MHLIQYSLDTPEGTDNAKVLRLHGCTDLEKEKECQWLKSFVQREMRLAGTQLHKVKVVFDSK